MWLYLKVLDTSAMGLLALVLIIMIILLIVSLFIVVAQKNKYEAKLQENLKFKDEIIKEYQKIRHDYNNMLQSFICFIEEEDLEHLKSYKEEVLAKTYLLNRNNITQLIKLKNMNIFTIIYKLLLSAEKEGVIINLAIYKEINDMHTSDIHFYNMLSNYIQYVYEKAAQYERQIDLKISANEQGICFAFENMVSSQKDSIASDARKTMKNNKAAKNIFLNTFLQQDKLIQEVLITSIK